MKHEMTDVAITNKALSSRDRTIGLSYIVNKRFVVTAFVSKNTDCVMITIHFSFKSGGGILNQWHIV